MSIQPVQFKDHKELNKFLNHLQTLGLITLGENSINIPNQEAANKLASQFLKAKDGKIYLLNDVQQFLQNATEEEIKATDLSFLIETKQKLTIPKELDDLPESQLEQFTIIKKMPVSLNQIKEDPSIIEKLLVDPKAGKFLAQLNPQLYCNSSYPKLENAKDIKEAIELYINNNFIQMIQENTRDEELLRKLLRLSSSVSTAESATIFRQDIYKITVIEGIKLKAQLLVELEKFKNQGERDLINQWIKTIEQNNLEIKRCLNFTIRALRKYCQLNEQDESKYKNMPSLTDFKAQIAAKKKKIKSLSNSISRLDILNYVLTHSTLFALTGLFIVGLGLVPVIIPPLAPLATIIYFTTMLVAYVLTFVFVDKIISKFMDIANFVESKINDYIKPKRSQLYELKQELQDLKDDLIWQAIYPQLAEECKAKGKASEWLAEKIENDLVEIDVLDPQEESVETSEPSSSSSFSPGSYKGTLFSSQPTPKVTDDDANDLKPKIPVTY